jgi:hypothetical protein
MPSAHTEAVRGRAPYAGSCEPLGCPGIHAMTLISISVAG